MASKRSAKKKTSPDKQKKAKEVLELSANARAEIAKLLKDEQDGKITRLEMETGLEEIDESLKRLMIFVRHLL
jgi:hypothetical protein